LLKVSKLGIAPGREQNSSVQNDSRIQNQTIDFDRRSSSQTLSSNSRLFRPSEMRKKKLKNFIGENAGKAERNPYATLEKDVIQKSLNFLTVDEKMKYLRRDTHKTEENDKEDEFDLKNLNKLIINQIKSKRRMIEDIEHKKFKLSTIQAFDKTKSRISSNERSKPMFDTKRLSKLVPSSASTTKLPLLGDNTLMISTKEPLHPSASMSAGIEKRAARIQHKQGEESLKLYLKLFESLKKRTLEKRAQEDGPLLVYGEKTNSTLSTENFPYRRIRSRNTII
jgi:hypothetical protein